jgi:hypothetical protein
VGDARHRCYHQFASDSASRIATAIISFRYVELERIWRWFCGRALAENPHPSRNEGCGTLKVTASLERSGSDGHSPNRFLMAGTIRDLNPTTRASVKNTMTGRCVWCSKDGEFACVFFDRGFMWVRRLEDTNHNVDYFRQCFAPGRRFYGDFGSRIVPWRIWKERYVTNRQQA